MEQEYIVHSGTKGMHWGTRLFQYKDGSLTPLGKIRYRKKRQEKLDNEQSNEPAKKSVKDMSDSELKEALNIKISKLHDMESKKYAVGSPLDINQYLIYRHCLLY